MEEHIVDTETPGANRLREHAFKLLSAGVVTLVGLATVVYHILESWSWVDSFYFSTVAVTTVGFGDLVPTKDSSKLFTVFYVITGITLVGTYLNERFRRLSGRVAKRRHPE
ncbi:MAG: potassium channel family protein [Actinomycetota bacterium]|nr:potassium channel family protein [Actinomycetota bacterium]